MPFLVLLDDGFVSFARVTSVSNRVVGRRACAAKLLTCQLSLFAQLHILGAFKELAECSTLSLQGLLHWVVSELEDQDILLDGAVIRGLDSDHNEHTQVLPERVLFACCAKLFHTKVTQ